MASPSRLETLPRELRDLIYIQSMQLTAPPPTRTYRTLPPPGSDGQLYLWTEHCPWKPLNLLLLSPQIRSETQDLITQLQKNPQKLRFHLDILAKGYIYTPKWTLQNLALQQASTLDLHVNLTVISTEAFRQTDHHHHPGHAFRTLINFLSRFIYLGPSFLHNNPNFTTPGPFYINTLSLDLKFRRDDDYTKATTHPETVREVFRMLKALSRLDTASKYIGRIRGYAEWMEGGEEMRREGEWDVQRRGDGTGQLLKEEDWAEAGFHFGDAWKRQYGRRRSSAASMG